MATRSRIAIKTEDGYRSIYAHWDGYPDHNGRMLLEYYSDPDKLAALIDHGSTSVLAPEIGEKHGFDAHNEEHPDWCLFYHRDRGDGWQNTAPETSPNLAALTVLAKDSWGEWLYVYEDGQWFFRPISWKGDCPALEPLADLFEKEAV